MLHTVYATVPCRTSEFVLNSNQGFLYLFFFFFNCCRFISPHLSIFIDTCSRSLFQLTTNLYKAPSLFIRRVSHLHVSLLYGLSSVSCVVSSLLCNHRNKGSRLTELLHCPRSSMGLSFMIHFQGLFLEANSR